jgi:hypothetical protein
MQKVAYSLDMKLMIRFYKSMRAQMAWKHMILLKFDLFIIHKYVLGTNNNPQLGFLQVARELFHHFLIDVLGKGIYPMHMDFSCT